MCDYDWTEPIPDALVDHTTMLYPRHNMLTHLGCVLLRTSIGASLICSPQASLVVIIVLTLVLIMFISKYSKMRNVKTWKCYPRAIIIYATCLYLIAKKEHKSAGVLLIMDGLMGLQSRHTASVLSCVD